MYRTSSVPNIRTIKAIRGESLTIDLGKVLDGDLEAWMKKDPDSSTYRSFDIVDNRYLYLTKDKASDYYDGEDNLLESVKGKWYFDVEQILDPLKPEEVKTIYRGTILFANDITNSSGVEISVSEVLEKEIIKPINGQTSITVVTNSIVDDDQWSVIVNGIEQESRTSNVNVDTGNISISHATGVITFHSPLSLGDIVTIKYN